MSGEVFSGDLPPSFAPGYLADEIANPRPLYIFSLKTLCREGARLRGRELELDDEPVSPVIDTLVTLGFAGAEVWVVSDRETGEMARTADWLGRNGVRPDALMLGCRFEGACDLDEEDASRLRGVFLSEGSDYWSGLPVFSVGEVASAPRIIV